MFILESNEYKASRVYFGNILGVYTCERRSRICGNNKISRCLVLQEFIITLKYRWEMKPFAPMVRPFGERIYQCSAEVHETKILVPDVE